MMTIPVSMKIEMIQRFKRPDDLGFIAALHDLLEILNALGEIVFVHHSLVPHRVAPGSVVFKPRCP